MKGEYMKFLLFIAVLCSTAAQAEGTRNSVVAFYPGQSWYLRYELDGVLEQYNNHKTGESTYAFAVGEGAGLAVSVQISPAGGAASAARCREDELARLRKNKDFGNQPVRFLDADGADMEVMVNVAEKGVSRHLHRYWLRDGLCTKLHASKTPFTESDRDTFAKLLASARFEPAGASVERGFVVPERGTLIVQSPPAWGFRTGKPGAGPRDITFLFADGNHQLMLTVFPRSAPILRGERTPRKYVENAREQSRSQAVETNPPLEEIAGLGANGYYFTITDKSLAGKPSEPQSWKYMKQGALTVGEGFVIFTLLSNDRDSAEVQAALAMLRQLRFDRGR
jgi:hypothetical protein